MHAEAYAYVARAARDLQRLDVLEIGGRNVNGSVRDLFKARHYTSIDTRPGPGVDVVAGGSNYQPPISPHVVVCCEVLEHTIAAEAIVHNAASILIRRGTLIVTCAAPPRAPHSGFDGAALRPGEYYKNVAADSLARWLIRAGFGQFTVEWNGDRGDLYATAIRR